MQIVQELGGYSLGRSDMVRRAMSKKKVDVMAKERENFINGCVKNSIDEKTANIIFDEMTDFAKYAFNKSHAAAYAVVAYQTAWLKKHYPVEFMASLMTSIMDRTDKIAEYIADCRSMGIETLPPDVNEGFGRFSVSDNAIRYALSAIKNVGTGNIKALVEERNKNGRYKSLTQFIERLGSSINTRCLESLILAGAFDSLGGKRAQYMRIYKGIYDGISQKKKSVIAGQISLFDIGGANSREVSTDNLPDIPEFSGREKLSYEKSLIGIYVSGHPLDDYIEVLKKHISHTTLNFPKSAEEFDQPEMLRDGDRVILGGVITTVSKKFTRKNQQMAFVTMEDLYGHIEVILFPDTYIKYMDSIKEENIILITGRATLSEDQEPKIICEQVTTYEELIQGSKTLWLRIPKGNTITPHELMTTLCRHRGQNPVKIYMEETKETLALNDSIRVSINDELIENMKSLLGDKSVIVK